MNENDAGINLAHFLRYVIDECSILQNRHEWAKALGVSLSSISQFANDINSPGPEILWRFVEFVRHRSAVDSGVRGKLEAILSAPAAQVSKRWKDYQGSVIEYILDGRERHVLDRVKRLPGTCRNAVLQVIELCAGNPDLSPVLSDIARALSGCAEIDGLDRIQLVRTITDLIAGPRVTESALLDDLLMKLDGAFSGCSNWTDLSPLDKAEQASALLKNYRELSRLANLPNLDWLRIEGELMRGVKSILLICRDAPACVLRAISQVRIDGKKTFPEADILLAVVEDVLYRPGMVSLSGPSLRALPSVHISPLQPASSGEGHDRQRTLP